MQSKIKIMWRRSKEGKISSNVSIMHGNGPVCFITEYGLEKIMGREVSRDPNGPYALAMRLKEHFHSTAGYSFAAGVISGTILSDHQEITLLFEK